MSHGLSEFLAMGGYGAFVWPAFAVTAVVMAGLWIDSVRRLRAGRRALERIEGAGRRSARAAGKAP